jgi:5-methylcytosine-specific restriction enzyme subunit McrC
MDGTNLTLSLFEHETLSLIGENVPLRDIHLRQLERLNQQTGVELVRLEYKRLRATSYVGVIQLGNATLQVLPKVDATGRDDRRDPHSVASAAANLLWMLVYAGGLPVYEGEMATLLKRRDNLFEILVRIFCQQLAEQLARGMYCCYQRREDSLPVLKGRWLLGQQLRRQPLARAKFLVAYDEFSPDNPLNRVLAYAVHYLRRMTKDTDNRRWLDRLRPWFEDVATPSHLSSSDLEQVTFSRLNAAYRPVFDLACLFLAQESLQLQAGQIQTFAFLFDMNLLFERFVAGFLRRHRDLALPERLRSCDVIVQGGSDSRWLAQTHLDGGRRVFRLKPDLLFRRPDETTALIVDTKYKTHHTISETDAYQMHAYATCYACSELVLLYPKARMPTQTLYLNGPIGQPQTRLRAQTIDLRHDLRTKAGCKALAHELAQALEGASEGE